MVKCLPIGDPNNSWNFCPNVAPSIIFALLFFSSTIFHLIQAIKYRKRYCAVIIIAAIWQTATYTMREVSIFMPSNDSIYSIWFIMILIAPLWTNAFVYMVVGRMVWSFLPNHKLGGIKAWRFGMGFVILDILAFLVQAFGASKASGNNISTSTIMQGLHIYMIGVGVQQAFIFLFCILLVRLHLRLRQEAPRSEVTSALRLLYVVYAALTLITIRIIFRLIEYSSGINSSIPNHEAFMFIFESLPMLIAIVLFNFVHPGAVMPGKDNDIPGRKERKTLFPKGSKKNFKGDGYEGIGYADGSREELPYNNAGRDTSYAAGPDVETQAELGYLAPNEPRY